MTYAEFLPAAGMAVVAWFLSHLIYGRFKPSIKAVLLTLLIATLIMAALGTLLFVGLYAAQISDFADAVADGPVDWAVFFVKLGLLTAFFWFPILLIVALSQARRVPNLS